MNIPAILALASAASASEIDSGDQNLACIPDQTTLVKDIEMYRKLAKAVVMLTSSSGTCSGFLVERGLILTAGHCVEEGKPVIVEAPKTIDKDGDISEIYLTVGMPEVVIDLNGQTGFRRDTSLLVVSKDFGDNFLKLSERNNVYIGMEVFSISHPNGSAWMMDFAIVDDVNTSYVTDDGDVLWEGNMLTSYPDCVFKAGSSGGPIINSNGEAVALNTATITDSSIVYAVSTASMAKYIRSRNIGDEVEFDSPVFVCPSDVVYSSTEDLQREVLFDFLNCELKN